MPRIRASVIDPPMARSSVVVEVVVVIAAFVRTPAADIAAHAAVEADERHHAADVEEDAAALWSGRDRSPGAEPDWAVAAFEEEGAHQARIGAFLDSLPCALEKGVHGDDVWPPRMIDWYAL